MNHMLIGAIAMSCFIASIYFLRFWKTTHDRFFLFFAVAFSIEGIGRIILGCMTYTSEQEPLIYLVRLFSFALILYAIFDKNLTKGPKVKR